MYGSEDPAVALPLLLEHVAAGRLELAPLLGDVFPLERIDDAVRASLELPAGRVLVEPFTSRATAPPPPAPGAS
jgi:Zn-dependent alcohol dehydrogenase